METYCNKYFLLTGRKTMKKIDLPSLFKEIYSLAFTSKQVVAGFSRADMRPLDSNAMKKKVARQPLATKQLNLSSPATRYYNIFDFRIKHFSIITFKFSSVQFT